MTKGLTLMTALVVVLLAIKVWKHASSKAITLSLVSLPPSLAQTELSARELTQLLRDKLDSLSQQALPNEGGGFALASEIELPPIEVPGAGIKLPELVDLITDVLGIAHRQAVWEVSARPQLAIAGAGVARGSTPRSQVWLMTAHLSGARSHQVPFDPAHPDSALSAIARDILADAAPVVLGRALMFGDDCEFARARASAHLRRDTSAKAMAQMYNTLGVTAECPGDDGVPDWGEAERYYRAAMELDPESVMPSVNLARTQMQQWADGQRNTEDSIIKTSLSVFERAAKRDSTLADVHAAWGWSYYLLDMSDSAIVHLKHAIALDPTAPLTYRKLAEVYLYMDSTAAAIQQLSLGLARDPNDVTTLRDYGHALLSRGDPLGASRAFRRAHRVDPTNIDTQFYLAEALQGAARGEALVHYCEVRRRTSRGEPYYDAADRAIALIVAAGHRECPRNSR